MEHVLSGLLAKRAEIAGQVEALQDQLRQTLIDMDHVDCTILLFDPDASLDEIKPKPLPPRHHAFKGQVTRAILAMRLGFSRVRDRGLVASDPGKGGLLLWRLAR